MAFASNSTYFDTGDGSIIGCFHEKDAGNLFEYSANNTGMFEENYPHLVWVAGADKIREGMESGWRYAKVKKTVAYIIIDEDDGGPILERWFLKDHNEYVPRS